MIGSTPMERTVWTFLRKVRLKLPEDPSNLHILVSTPSVKTFILKNIGGT